MAARIRGEPALDACAMGHLAERPSAQPPQAVCLSAERRRVEPTSAAGEPILNMEVHPELF